MPKRHEGKTGRSNREDMIIWANESVGRGLAALDRMKLATFAALCGKPLPEGAGPDSVNQLPALLGKDGDIPPRPALVTATCRGLLTLRKGDWKAILGTKWSGGHSNEKHGGPGPEETRDDPSSGQLYNLAENPREQNDLWGKHPELVQRLGRQLENIKQLEPNDEFRK